MKVLIEIHGSAKKRFLVRLPDQKVIDEIRNLINKEKHTEAIMKALSRGIFIKDITERDMPYINADIILSEDHAYFDLT